MNIDLQTFLAEYREKRAKDIEETRIYTSEGWNLNHHNRIVFFCPKCKAKIGAEIDTSEGPQDEMHHECEACKAEITLYLGWRTEPELINVQILADD